MTRLIIPMDAQVKRGFKDYCTHSGYTMSRVVRKLIFKYIGENHTSFTKSIRSAALMKQIDSIIGK